MSIQSSTLLFSHSVKSVVLLLSFHLRLGLPCGLLLSGFPTTMLKTALHLPIMLHALPKHNICAISWFLVHRRVNIMHVSHDCNIPYCIIGRYNTYSLQIKYSPMNLVWKYSNLIFILMWHWPSLASIQKRKNYSFVDRNCHFF